MLTPILAPVQPWARRICREQALCSLREALTKLDPVTGGHPADCDCGDCAAQDHAANALLELTPDPDQGV